MQTIECYIENFVLIVAVTKHSGIPSLYAISNEHSSAQGSTVPEKKELVETILLIEPFSEEMMDDAALLRKSLQQELTRRGNPLAPKNLLWFQPMREEGLMTKRRGFFFMERGNQRFHTESTSQLVHALPYGPNL